MPNSIASQISDRTHRGSRPKEGFIRLSKTITALYIVPFCVPYFFAKGQQNVNQVAHQTGGIGNYLFISFLATCGFFVICFLLLQRSSRNIKKTNVLTPAFVLLSLLYLLEIISASWSDMPTGSLYHTIPNLSTILYIMVIANVADVSSAPLEILRINLEFAVRFLVCMLALLIISSGTGSGGFEYDTNAVLPRMYGSWFSIQPNISGFIATFCLTRYLSIPTKWNLLDIISVAICLVVFVFSQDRTQYITLLIVLFVLSFWNEKIRILLFGLMLVIFALGATEYDAVLRFVSRGGGMSNLTQMTGRTVQWSAALDFGSKRLFEGWGAWSGVAIDYNLQYSNIFKYKVFSGIDNAFLQVFIDCGLFGVTLFLLYFVTTFFKVLSVVRSGRLQEFAFVAFLALALRATVGLCIVSFDPSQIVAAFILLFATFGHRGRLLTFASRPPAFAEDTEAVKNRL